MTEPIPVTERYPEYKPWPNGERVLAYVPERNGAYGAWFIARCCDGYWQEDTRDEETLPDVSHWMPLPPPPQGSV